MYKIPYIGPSFQSIITKIATNEKYLFQNSEITKLQNFCKMLGERCETGALLWRRFPKFCQVVSK